MKKLNELTYAELQEQLKTIPEEYQTLVQETIEQEIQDGEHDATDADRLAYLRGRLKDMENGAYIRPDGKTALITAAHPDEVYGADGVDSMAGDSEAAARQAERNGNLLKLGGLGAVALIFFLFIFMSARNRAKAEKLPENDLSQTPTAVTTDTGIAATPTADLPAMADGSSSLRAIGSLGAKLTIGRPAALELHFQETEEVVALAVDPARLSKRGELPFDDETMASADPVAVWIHGTVLNYAMGIPTKLSQGLQAGDRIVLNTDIGQEMRFVITETWVGNSYDAPRYLSQDRVGMTLFSLPSPAEDGVTFILANYDTSTEDTQIFDTNKVGEAVHLTDKIAVNVLPDVVVNHTPDGLVSILVSGTITQEIGSLDHLSLSLSSAAGGQTPSSNLSHLNNHWAVEFLVTDSFLNADIFAQIRAIPANTLQTVHLGRLTAPQEQLQVLFSEAYWQPDSGQVILTVQVTNDGPAVVRLDPTYFSLQGGDVQQEIQTQPPLPVLLNSQEALFLELSFLAPDERQHQEKTFVLKTREERWEIPFFSPN